MSCFAHHRVKLITHPSVINQNVKNLYSFCMTEF